MLIGASLAREELFVGEGKQGRFSTQSSSAAGLTIRGGTFIHAAEGHTLTRP
jgi:hypothetical protein